MRVTAKSYSSHILGAFGLAAICLAGCGSEDTDPGLRAWVHIEAGLTRDDVDSLTFYALAPARSDDILLTCSTLMDGVLQPSSEKITVLADLKVQGPFGGADFVLKDISAGEARLLYITAHEASGAVLGQGCTADIKVPAGGSVEVDVSVYPS